LLFSEIFFLLNVFNKKNHFPFYITDNYHRIKHEKFDFFTLFFLFFAKFNYTSKQFFSFVLRFKNFFHENNAVILAC